MAAVPRGSETVNTMVAVSDARPRGFDSGAAAAGFLDRPDAVAAVDAGVVAGCRRVVVSGLVTGNTEGSLGTGTASAVSVIALREYTSLAASARPVTATRTTRK